MIRRILSVAAVVISMAALGAAPASAAQVADIFCTTYTINNADTGVAVCFNNNASRKGYAQLWVKCTSGMNTYWQDSGWYPVKAKTSIYIYTKCPTSRVKDTRYDSKW